MPIQFDYAPLRGAKKIVKWQVSQVGFGSGYHSATALGREVRWQVGFVVECLEDLHELVNVFIEAKGVDTLLWTPPSHDLGEFVLSDWKVTPLRNDAYRIDVDLKLIEVITLGGNQSSDLYYTAHSSSIQALNLAAQFGSTQTTSVRNVSLQYANQYQERNYDDVLRSVFESWDVQVNGLSSLAATELDAFLDARRGEKPFLWDDGVCANPGGGGTVADGTGEGSHADHYYKCSEWEFEYLVGEDVGVEECLNGVVNFKATFDQCYGIYLIETPTPTNLKAIYAASHNSQPYQLYIGGDGRASDTLIDTLPAGATNISVFLTNLGRGFNDWIAGVKFREANGNWTIRNYFGMNPSQNWTISKNNVFLVFYNTRPGSPYVDLGSEFNNQIKNLFWCGHGFWASGTWAFWWYINNDRYAQIVCWNAYNGSIGMHQSEAQHRIHPNTPQIDLELTYPITPRHTTTMKHRYPAGFDFGNFPLDEGEVFCFAISDDGTSLIRYINHYPGNNIDKMRLIIGQEIQRELSYWRYPIDYFSLNRTGHLFTFTVNDYASGDSDAEVEIQRVQYDTDSNFIEDRPIYRTLKKLQYYQQPGYSNQALDVAFFPGDEDYAYVPVMPG